VSVSLSVLEFTSHKSQVTSHTPLPPALPFNDTAGRGEPGGPTRNTRGCTATSWTASSCLAPLVTSHKSQVTSHQSLLFPGLSFNAGRGDWRPNTQYKRLYSHILDCLVRMRVTTHALRCIDKAGLRWHAFLKTPEEKLNSDVGVEWKRCLERIRDQRRTGGIQAVPPAPTSLAAADSDSDSDTAAPGVTIGGGATDSGGVPTSGSGGSRQ